MLFCGGGAAALALLAALGWAEYQKRALAEALARPLVAPLALEIPRGASLADIAAAAAADSPVSPAEFILLARKLNIGHKLQAGHYEFASGESVGEMLAALAEGKVAPAHRFTIVEGLSYRDVRARLRADTRLEQRLPAMSEEEIRVALGVERESLEGLFLPETYFFDRGDSDLDVLRRAQKKMQTTLESLWETRADGGLYQKPYEALALASIVEKETGAAEERELIASVFMNRLRKKMPLQADPTVIYGLGESFDGNLTRAHLRDKSNPYNTYARRGLTPTPIALPGRAAIAAALNPADSDYYYFVASGGGRHVFSRTLREHNNAVNKYQRRRGQ